MTNFEEKFLGRVLVLGFLVLIDISAFQGIFGDSKTVTVETWIWVGIIAFVNLGIVGTTERSLYEFGTLQEFWRITNYISLVGILCLGLLAIGWALTD
jgi:hypothetical protein